MIRRVEKESGTKKLVYLGRTIRVLKMDFFDRRKCIFLVNCCFNEYGVHSSHSPMQLPLW